MDESKQRLLSLYDDAIPALPAVLGPDAPAILQAAVEPAGGSIASARLAQVSWTPGRSLNAVFQARIHLEGGRMPVEEHLVVSTGPASQAGGVELEDAMGSRVSVWRMAEDPALPGLALPMDPARARLLLDGLGVPPGTVTPSLRAYRPTRRAVVELTTPRQRVFVKVVPPARVAELQRLHAQMSAELPVPRSHGWSHEHGLVVLQALPGVSLRKCIVDPRLALPDPSQLSQLLDRVPTPEDGRSAPSQAGSARQMEPLLQALVPEYETAIAGLTQAFEDDRQARPEVPVHGDLHEAQLTVQDGNVAGLLDIDTAGLGERIDDWATLLGHLATLEGAVPPNLRERVRAYGRRIIALADHQAGDPHRLRVRVAAVILGLATGPFRVQMDGWLPETRRRIDLATSWVESARGFPAHEKALRSL